MTLRLLSTLILLGSSLYHFLIGSLSAFFPQVADRMMKSLYAMKHTEMPRDPRFEYVYYPMGAYALAISGFSLWGALPNHEPTRQFTEATLAGLFLVRAYFRYKKRALVEEAFGIPFNRSLFNVAFNVAIAAVLLFESVPT